MKTAQNKFFYEGEGVIESQVEQIWNFKQENS